MRRDRLREAGCARLAPWIGRIALIGATGCGATTPLGRAGVSLAPPDDWSRDASGGHVVPGTPIAAWAGPRGASLVVYTTLPIPSPDDAALAAELATRSENLPGVSILAQGVETRDGLAAARVEMVGPGTGGAFVPSGIGRPIAPAGVTILPTRRVVVSFPRRSDTLHLVWHYPDSAHPEIGPGVEATLGSLKIIDPAKSLYSY